MHVERAVDIARPPATVFALLNGFEHFDAWSPWADRDPSATFEVSGPATGVGARIQWDGDPRLVGSGWQEIVESRPWSLIGMTTDVDQQGRADSYFHLVATQQGTRVTWAFDADLVTGQGFFGALLARYFGLFFDRWIGQDQEAGLARLRTLAESLPGQESGGLEMETLQVEPVDIVYVPVPDAGAAPDIATALAEAFTELSDFLAASGVETHGQPMAITRDWTGREHAFEAAIPVPTAGLEPAGRVRIGKSPGGLAVRAVHRGPYAQMPASYQKLSAYIEAHGLREGRVSWEHYISDPGETPPEALVTHIYFLVTEDGEAGEDG